MNKSEWVWMPHTGHFICGRDCRFHLNTYVGDYIVSTLGELEHDSAVRETIAQSRGVTLKGQGDVRRADYMKKIGFKEIGVGRKYETMVFRAKESNHKCCPYEMVTGENLDMDGYNSADDAYEGHLKMCAKWAETKLQSDGPEAA